MIDIFILSIIISTIHFKTKKVNMQSVSPSDCPTTPFCHNFLKATVMSVEVAAGIPVPTPFTKSFHPFPSPEQHET